MLRYLVIGVVGLLGAVLVVAAGTIFHFWIAPYFEPAPPAVAEVHPLQPLPDVDALAHRLPHAQEVYEQLRDEALADYAKLHPGTHPIDAEAQGTLRLFAYLCVWDDFYGEGLWRAAVGHATHLLELGQHDQIWKSIRDIQYYSDRHSRLDSDVDQLNHCANQLAAERWPAVFRLEACRIALKNMVSAKTDNAIRSTVGPSLDALAPMADQSVACYREMVRAHFSHWFLYRDGDVLLEAVSGDEPTLIQVSKGLDSVFAVEDRDNPQVTVLDGDFYVMDAWNARGGGYADTVTADGWSRFRDRLQRADVLLNGVFAQLPREPGVARTMMTVTLGEQAPRDQMELWFQRGQQAEGNLFNLYLEKRGYLLPRWYGSDRDVWQFGLECAHSPDWAGKIPIMLAECISDRAENDPAVFADPDVWQPVEKVYRDYLAHYPDSVHYRSMFALNAAQGSHWDVAREQFKILGQKWDEDVFPDNLYAETVQQVNAH